MSSYCEEVRVTEAQQEKGDAVKNQSRKQPVGLVLAAHEQRTVVFIVAADTTVENTVIVVNFTGAQITRVVDVDPVSLASNRYPGGSVHFECWIQKSCTDP